MNVSLLYPWADILARRTGASVRVGCLIDFLRERCDRLTVLSTEPDADGWHGGVEYRSLDAHGLGGAPVRGELGRALLWRALYLSLTRKSGSTGDSKIFPQPLEVEVLNFFLGPRFDRNFRAAIESRAQQSDLMFLEYPFWASTVIPVCRARGVPTVVTAYDILSRTFGAHMGAKRVLEREELRALRHADYPCCVSEEDQRFFAQHGVDARCAHNPLDVERCHVEPRSDVVDGFRVSRALGDTPVCLFFGSRHPPNCDAAEILEHQIAPRVPEATFVIAGTCAPPGRSGNVLKLGEVTEGERRILYTLASLVTIPLHQGTGSSLKLIEALAYGKPVVTTQVGARGYPLKHGVHAVVADHVPAHAKLITALLQDPTRREELGRRGRAFAERYDYKRVFTAYEQVLADVRASGARATVSAPS